MTRLLLIILACVAAWSGTVRAQDSHASAMTYTYYDGQVELGHIKRFHWKVLEAALKRTRGAYGDYRLIALPPVPGSRQRHELMQEHPPVTIAVFDSSEEETRRLVPVRIPIDRGLLGYRLLLIREGDQGRFDKIRSLADLKPVRFGLMPWWSEVRIMQGAGMPVVEGESYDGLFRMLSAGRFDAFSRGATEISADLKRGRQFAPDLVIERHLLLHYPLPVYFWFTDDTEGRRRAERVRAGLTAMVADGSLAAMIKDRYRAELAELGLAGRRVIELPNPELDGKDPLGDGRLWFRP